MFRRRSIAVVLAIGLTLTGSGLVAEAADPPIPVSMAALGDSITTGYNTGPSSYQDYPAGSWSTGTVLNSHAKLLGIPATAAFNDAVSGATMANLKTQALKIQSGVSYVTILMGGNDLCTKTEDLMTKPAAFGADFAAALDAIPASTYVFVASIPRVNSLWDTLHTNGSARFIWSIFGICQSLLANPGSLAPLDAARRSRVDARNVELNSQLATVCAKHTNCRFDSGLTVYNTKFAATDVSTRDYFHPSPNGQKLLACVTWKASYWAGTRSC